MELWDKPSAEVSHLKTQVDHINYSRNAYFALDILFRFNNLMYFLAV